MALILEDEGKHFSGRQVIIPKYLVDKLKERLNVYSDKSYKQYKGYKRLNSLLNKNYNNQDNKKSSNANDYTISFADVKRIDFDMRHMPQSNDNLEYDMIGGDDMRDFVSNTLKSLRNSVSKVKEVPEVPKLETNDVKPKITNNKDVNIGGVNVTLESKEFINKIHTKY